MTLRWQGGALQLTRPDGTVIFNSDEQLFHGTDYLTGSFSFDAQEVYMTGPENGSYVNTTDTTVLKPVHPNATHLVGFFRRVWGPTSTRNGTSTVFVENTSTWGELWKEISGTHIFSTAPLDNTRTRTADQPVMYYFIGSIFTGTFTIENSSMVFKRRLIMRASTTPSTASYRYVYQPSVTITYRALAGFFT